jgi:hypothetical protein
MATYVILRNMIIEDERVFDLKFFFYDVGTHVKPTKNSDWIQAFLETYVDTENPGTHNQLQLDLIRVN